MCRPGPSGHEGPAAAAATGIPPRREARGKPAAPQRRCPPGFPTPGHQEPRGAEPPPRSPTPGTGAEPSSGSPTPQSWGEARVAPTPPAPSLAVVPGDPAAARGLPAQSETAPAAGPIRRRLPGTPRCPPLSASFQEPRAPAATPPRRPGRAPRPNPRTNCNPIKADIILLVFTAHQGGDNNRRCRRAAARKPPAPAGSGGPRAAACRAGTLLTGSGPAPASAPSRSSVAADGLPAACAPLAAPAPSKPPSPRRAPRFRHPAPRFNPARPQPSGLRARRRRQSRASGRRTPRMPARWPDPVSPIPVPARLAVPCSAARRALSVSGRRPAAEANAHPANPFSP